MDDPKTKTTSTAKTLRGSCLASILKIASAMSVTLSEATQAVYLEQLQNLAPERLAEAVQRTLMEWDRPHMMPPIAFILARTGASPKLLAEQAWDWTQRYIRKHWHVDVGHYQGAPEIPAATDYAIRQCGGLARIAYPTDRDVDFIRKGFLEAHQRFVEEGGEQVRLSDTDAKRILGNLRIAADSAFAALPAIIDIRKEL